LAAVAGSPTQRLAASALQAIGASAAGGGVAGGLAQAASNNSGDSRDRRMDMVRLAEM
jgi:hypothetical protein